MNSLINYRKFSWATLALILASAGLFADKLSGSEFVTGLTILAGVFMGSNVGEHFARRSE